MDELQVKVTNLLLDHAGNIKRSIQTTREIAELLENANQPELKTIAEQSIVRQKFLLAYVNQLLKSDTNNKFDIISNVRTNHIYAQILEKLDIINTCLTDEAEIIQKAVHDFRNSTQIGHLQEKTGQNSVDRPPVRRIA